MSKDVADEKFVIPNLCLSYHHFVPTHPSIPGFDRGLIELMQRALCDIFAASKSLWISYGD